MKKIEKVSIADISFTLDNDAYVSLKQYIDSLHSYYDKDPDGSEIIADIEARIAELILNEQVYTKVVSKRLVDTIVAQLGTPEEIDDDATETGRDSAQPAPDSSIPRRLYRSFEGRIFGGICSGMAHFWNINVAWLRLLFLTPFIMFIIAVPFDWSGIMNFFLGLTWVFVVIYAVLWMAIPIAKTPRQKLESRGEKITPSSIRQNLQENAKTPSSKKAASVAAEILAVIGRVFLFLIKFVVAVIGFAFLITALALLIGMIAVPFVPAAAPSVSIFGWDLLSNADISSVPLMLLAELIMFCVMVPFFVIGMALLSLVFNWKLGRLFYIITLGVWFLAAIACTVVAAVHAKDLRDGFRSGNVAIGWFSDEYSDEKELLKKFLEKEDDGVNSITINVAGDSVEVVSWRDYTSDSLPLNSGDVLQYRKRIVLKDPAAVKEALRLSPGDKQKDGNKRVKSVTIQVQSE